MQYSYSAKNDGKDLIYSNRLRLIYKYNINVHSSRLMYNLFMDAYLGIILD